MDKTNQENLNPKSGPTTEKTKEDKSEAREREREIRVDEQTSQTFHDVLKSTAAEVVSILDDEEDKESLMMKKMKEEQDKVEIYSPFLNERPPPLENFREDLLPDFVKKTAEQLNYKEPTPIQKHCNKIDLMAITQSPVTP